MEYWILRKQNQHFRSATEIPSKFKGPTSIGRDAQGGRPMPCAQGRAARASLHPLEDCRRGIKVTSLYNIIRNQHIFASKAFSEASTYGSLGVLAMASFGSPDSEQSAEFNTWKIWAIHQPALILQICHADLWRTLELALNLDTSETLGSALSQAQT